ncbi:Splicing factor-like protein [Parasponia andersonii]|uniref:Splicing factor-like protein n=1 Tax=Parasponia andersonii TaxID=3476 RepID=A0A2P5CDE8_PARAD|nr:Splicing factor-like protein [Parasponia andersonii]
MATTMTFQGYPQQPQPQTQHQQHHQPTTVEEVRTLWIGDLQYWVDENYLNTCFAHTGEVISIKIIRNKITGQPEGYGFVEFVSHAAAERILQSYNGTQMPGTEQTFRLNWASFGIGERRPDAGPEHSIFVGDLAPDVTDYLLQETFRAQYPSVRGAKVVTDPNTGRSKGYGFVKFSDETERNRAMTEMNGVYCSTRPMRISAATPKKTTGFQQQYTAAKAVYPFPAYTTPAAPVAPADYDTNNTTFSNGFSVSSPSLAIQTSAEEAIQKMQGKMIGQQIVRISWGRSPTAKQIDGVQDMAAIAAAAPALEQREELDDPLATPDVDKLNAAYLAVHGSAILGRPLWLRTSSFPQQA